jgi:oxysterol-binding protein 1
MEDSEDSSIVYYDALDHLIIDELEKETSWNKRKETDYRKDEKRDTLPALKPKSSINIFKILKDSIGKDLSKFWVPVYFNEPLSMLQKVTEIFQNEYLLSKAAEQEDPLLRMVYVAAFCIAQYGGTQWRWSKPFNPILGETFEFKTPDWRFVAEQVSHHPPISAGYLEHEKYECWMNTHMKTKFWGRSLEFRPLGNIHYKFHDNDDHFVCKRPNSSVNNIILGTMYVNHSGESTVVNLRTGDKADIKFKTPGMFEGKSKKGAVEATIENEKGEEKYVIFGKWTDSISFRKSDQFEEEGKLLWEFPPIPEDWESIYHFTEFTLQLNLLTDRMKTFLPPTDSRLRSDQRFLENGDLKLANSEKKRLEEKQRRRRKRMEEEKFDYKPRYFVKEEDDHLGDEGYISYRYLGDYWEDREKHNWEDMPDLFGPDTPENSDED